MTESFNWQCPHCGRHTTINKDRISGSHHRFNLDSKYGNRAIYTLVICCPNDECRELTVRASIGDWQWLGASGQVEYGSARETWRLIPAADVKVFPDYVPAPIIEDYRESCLIKDSSPKAGATLARRCLQGMIRDFWGVSKTRLVDEIEGIKEMVDASTWAAIDGVRKIGNIGAHMEQDINLIVEVDPGEAGVLIRLIETLITDWYVARHEREQRMKAVVAIADAKEQERTGGSSGNGEEADSNPEPTD